MDEHKREFMSDRSGSPTNVGDDNKSFTSWKRVNDSQGNEYFYEEVSGASQVSSL